MKNNFLFFAFLIIMIACVQENKKIPDGSIPLSPLETKEEKKKFLEDIYSENETLRNSKTLGSKITIQDYLKMMSLKDSLNLIKVEFYLNNYGYPKKKDFGIKASLAPINVLMQADVKIRIMYFKLLYNAYLNKNLDKEAFTLYLNRIYQIQYQQKLKIDAPDTEDDRIRLLIKALKLQ